MERDSKNEVADSFNLILDVVSVCAKTNRTCVAGTPFKLGSTLYCEEPRMQRQDLAGD